MMTIEGVLDLKGSEMTLYAPEYFKTVDQLLTMIQSGRVYLYGWELVKHSPTVITLDADKIIDQLKNLSFTYENRTFKLDKARAEGDTDDWFTDESWRVSRPPIPPENGYYAENKMCNMWALRIRYLHERDHTTPVYYSVDQDTKNFFNALTEEADATTKQIKVVSHKRETDLRLIQNRYKFDPRSALYFVNGLCCYPTIIADEELGEVISLKDGGKYLRNQMDRDRGTVIMSFDGLANLTYYPTSVFASGPKTWKINNTINPDGKSYLLVVDGRLYFPGEFRIFNDHTMIFDIAQFRDEYSLDRKCCENDFVCSEEAVDLFGKPNGLTMAYTRTLSHKSSTSAFKLNNSFLIEFDRPDLQIIRHKCQDSTNNDAMLPQHRQGMQSKVQFNASAQGILFDTTTRSVVDHVREYNDMTFYVRTGKLPLRWYTVTAYLKNTTPLDLWAKYNNDMSASATMHDRNDVRGSAFTLWPKYTMLDFMFGDD